MDFWCECICYILFDEDQAEQIGADEDNDPEKWTDCGPWEPKELEFKQVLVKGCWEEAGDPIEDYDQHDIP